MRELKLRGLVERILVVCPANLAFQWQRELKEKFDEKFLVFKGSDIRDQFGVNQWIEQRLELPRFSGQLKAVGISTEVRDSRLK